ncbi:MAG: PAS domain S-box protein [Anaerolineae bacterium]
MQEPMTVQQGAAFYRQLLETIDDVVYVVDGGGRVVYASPAIVPLLGYSPEEAVGRHFQDFVHGDDLPRAQRAFETRLAGERVKHEYRVVTRSGQVRWVRSTVRLIQTGDGSPGLCGVLVDITEQHQMQEDLSLKDKAIASSVNAIAMADVEGRLTYVNPAFLRMWGYASEAEVLGRPAVSFWEVEAEAERAVHGMQRQGHWVGELVARREDGTRFDVQLSASLVSGQAGEPVGMMAFFIDVTQRNKVEEELRLNNMRLDSLMELSQKAHQLSEHEIVQVAIEEAARLTGSEIGYLHFVDPDENTLRLLTWTKKTREQCAAVYDDHYPVDRAGVWADCIRLKRPIIHNDYQVLPDRRGYPEGHVHLVRLVSVPVFEDEEAAMILGVGNKAVDYDEADVRQMLLIGNQLLRLLRRKRADEQVRASLREKEVLLQEVHHRVKNNLQIISSLLDIQSQGVEEPRAQQVLQDSRNRIRAMAFVHDRLYQARDLASIDLDDYIRSVVSYLHGVYGSLAQNIALHLQIEQVPLDLDTAIPCGLIINELVSNALKYAFPPDSSSGDVWIEFSAQPDGQLALAVCDNGCGLAPHIDLDTTPSLGLQLVRMLSEQLRGTVHLSREGGTAFRIVFPGPARGGEHGTR